MDDAQAISDQQEADRPLSVLDIAIQLGLKADEDGNYSAEGLMRHGFAMIGGCQCCYATIACYNAFPSKNGYWKCRDCIDVDGFTTLEQYNSWKVQNDNYRAQYNEG